MGIIYKINKSSSSDINRHLEKVDPISNISRRVDISLYSKKIRENAITFEAWDNNILVGLIACYVNNQDTGAFITYVGVVKEYRQQGIAFTLLSNLISEAIVKMCGVIRLKVNIINNNAILLYKKSGFCLENQTHEEYTMIYRYLDQKP
ncbi:MAG: GNAT family N-acetyltransferase [Bacteroidales bacterium]